MRKWGGKPPGRVCNKAGCARRVGLREALSERKTATFRHDEDAEVILLALFY